MRRGFDGWTLEDYDWNEKTGVAQLTYERTTVEAGLETRVITRAQPYSPTHVGWYTRQ